MSQLIFYFQPSFSGWMPTKIFEYVYQYYNDIYKEQIIKNHTISHSSDGGSRRGVHNLIIENQDTKKYKIISYWDRVYELLDDQNGDWDNKNCLGIYSSVDAVLHEQIIPSSYCVLNTDIANKIDIVNKNFIQKSNNKLLFRGYLHSERYFLNEAIKNNTNQILQIFENRIPYLNYVDELNSYMIGLSLNGAAEICNRDMEILGVGSVLLRPKLIKTNFHNPLIENFHYVSYDVCENQTEQLEIILDKYNQIINDKEYMFFIANNGNEWYRNNGSLEGNVSVLLKILNIEQLF